MEAFFDPSYTVIQANSGTVSAKIRVLPSGTLSETWTEKMSPQHIDRQNALSAQPSPLTLTYDLDF